MLGIKTDLENMPLIYGHKTQTQNWQKLCSSKLKFDTSMHLL